MTKGRIIKKNIIVYIFPFVLLLLLVTYFRDSLNGMLQVSDEFGYWSAGDYLSGRLSWREFSSWLSYYGWGYGVLLGILLRLPFSTVALYKIAVIINALLLFGIYCMVYAIANTSNATAQINRLPKVFFSLAITCMTANLYYSWFTMSEVILSFFIGYYAFGYGNTK